MVTDKLYKLYKLYYVRNIGQGEARHRKYKRLKLGDGQAYDRSSDQTIIAEATRNSAKSAVLSLN
jgi:hypothetical protein